MSSIEMDSSIKSLKGFGKVDETEEQTFKKKSRKRLIILIISSIVLLNHYTQTKQFVILI